MFYDIMAVEIRIPFQKIITTAEVWTWWEFDLVKKTQFQVYGQIIIETWMNQTWLEFSGTLWVPQKCDILIHLKTNLTINIKRVLYLLKLPELEKTWWWCLCKCKFIYSLFRGEPARFTWINLTASSHFWIPWKRCNSNSSATYSISYSHFHTFTFIFTFAF